MKLEISSAKDCGKYVRSEKGTDTASVTKTAVKDTSLNQSLKVTSKQKHCTVDLLLQK